MYFTLHLNFLKANVESYWHCCCYCIPFTLHDNLMDLMEWNGLLCTNIHKKAFFFFVIAPSPYFFPLHPCQCVPRVILFSYSVCTLCKRILLIYVYILSFWRLNIFFSLSLVLFSTNTQYFLLYTQKHYYYIIIWHVYTPKCAR